MRGGRMPAMIEVSNLAFDYGGKHRALDGISFSVERGEVVGLLGPNGAGKSTAVKLITGLLKPTSGSITVSGMEVSQSLAEVRRLIGFMPQETALYQDLSADETLEYHAALYGIPKAEVKTRADQMLDLAGLLDRRRDLVKTYSGGMKRRLALVRAMMHQSEVLILDEMSLGVDVQSRKLIWDQVRSLKKEGRTVLFCTNYMDEVEALADRVVILDRGRLVAEGTPRALTQKHLGNYVIELAVDGMAVSQGREWVSTTTQLTVEKVSEAVEGAPRTVWIKSGSGPSDLPLAIKRLSDAGLQVREASLRAPSLGDVFLAITGSKLRD